MWGWAGGSGGGRSRRPELNQRGAIVRGQTTQDRTLGFIQGNALSLLILLALAALVLVPYLLVWGSNPLLISVKRVGLPVFWAVIAIGTALHEAIHGITWMVFGRLGWTELAFGVSGKTLSPFVHAKVPLLAGVYRLGVAMPGLLLGAGPALVGIGGGHPLPAIFGAIFLGLAAGDLLILVLLIGVPSDAFVQDAPHRVGCQVISQRQ